ncbi:DUF397 domain-containing protein [Micromonospora sp. NBC_01813]|jgi:hypothetical protein|uniref:DUF397 domain-containing protein n=1 Tax=Micromonospora sp. NBC_01813 TaxID=2975988 RepID=UPI002DDA0893|nr:DUF397 domain-containing protein [Micromonospora sp. NBC_01813]WSA07231.1 DUF397 domain-containing protein [Micromonospora sp. NBC_01813]
MDLSTAPCWRTSTYSESGSCVEVADNLPGRVLVRDTKDRSGPALTFDPSAWRSFVELAKHHH